MRSPVTFTLMCEKELPSDRQSDLFSMLTVMGERFRSAWLGSLQMPPAVHDWVSCHDSLQL